MENEIWKDVVGYDGLYQVSNLGRVKSVGSYYHKEIILKEQFFKQGYSKTTLYKKGKPKSFKTHRLVALAFIHNPENKPQINHKDGNKSNNCVDNLEWVSAKENMQHALKTGLRTFESICKPVKQIKNNVVVATYVSKNDAQRKTGINNIEKVLKGKLKTAGGFYWEYL